MTEEEKEAIEYFENDIKKRKQGKNYFVDYEKVMTYEEIVLNLLQKQQKEIDKLNVKNKDLLRKLKNRVKEVKKLTKYSLYKKEFSTLNAKLEKKDKIIDLILQDMINQKCYSTSKTTLRKIYKKKVSEE